MKKSFGAWVLIVALSIVVTACSKKDSGKAKITIRSSTQANAEVKITLLDALDQITISESKTDSSGNSSFEIELQKPVFATIRIGKTSKNTIKWLIIIKNTNN